MHIKQSSPLKKMSKTGKTKTKTGNLLAKNHRVSYLKPKELIFGEMREKLLTQNKLTRRTPDQATTITKRRRTTSKIK